jgi:hypothetical protein
MDVVLKVVDATGAILETILRGTFPIWNDRLPWDAYGRW